MVELILNNTKLVYGLDEEQRLKVKDSLLVENPAYHSAKTYSGYRNVRIDKYLTYYNETRDYLEVPIGYTLPYPFKVRVDLRKEVTVDYPKIQIKLRPIQEEALFSYLNDPDKGIISLPTGKGKSILGIHLAYTLKQKTLVIVHKDDLITGWRKDIEMCFNNAVVPGLVKAQKRVVGEQITLATIQTLSRMDRDELKKYIFAFGLVIVDEMHHISSSIYGLINEFCAPYKLGLSATPERSDGLTQVMHFYLGDFSFVYKSDHTDEDILPVKVRVTTVPTLFRPMVNEHMRAGSKYYTLTPDEEDGDFYIDEIAHNKRPKISFHKIVDFVLNDATYQKKFLEDIMEEHKLGRSIILFLHQKEHCRTVYDLLLNRNVPEACIQLYYGDSAEKKEVLLERAENERNLITIATYSIATEGTNVKQWEVAFLLSSLNDGKNVEQAVGRIRRAMKNKINPVVVYDYRFPNVYLMRNHGFTRDRRYKSLGFDFSHKSKRPLFRRGYK